MQGVLFPPEVASSIILDYDMNKTNIEDLGYLQDFRPAPGLRNQVYRLNDETGAVTVAADGFTLPNGRLD